MFSHHIGEDAATHVELAGQAHEAGVRGPHQVIQDAVGDGLMEMSLVPEGPDVELQALQLHAARVRNVVQEQGGKVRLAGLGAQTGEFRDLYMNMVIPARLGVVEGFQGFAGLAGHDSGPRS